MSTKTRVKENTLHDTRENVAPDPELRKLVQGPLYAPELILDDSYPNFPKRTLLNQAVT